MIEAPENPELDLPKFKKLLSDLDAAFTQLQARAKSHHENAQNWRDKCVKAQRDKEAAWAELDRRVDEKVAARLEELTKALKAGTLNI